MNETLKRVLAATVFIPLFLFTIFNDWQYGILFTFVIAGISTLATLELFDIFKSKELKHIKSIGILFNLFAITLFYLSTRGTGIPIISLVALLISLIITVFLVETFKNQNYTKSTELVGTYIFNFAYSGLMLGHVVLLKSFPNGDFIILLMLVITWFTDTGAYFTGKYLGKHKLNLKSSPNKTLEGYIGGFISAVCFGVLLITLFPDEYNISYISMVLLSGIISIISVFGDLAESIIKRSSGVKDSKSYIPGHGGVLDVFDSMIYTSPVLYYLITFGVFSI